MSDTETTSEDIQVDELALLKQRADTLGITYSPRIGIDALKDKIERALSDEGKEDGAAEEDASDAAKVDGVRPMSKAEREAKLRKEIHDEEMKLVRVRIVNLNPAKKDLRGEFLAVANKYLGIVKKYIPYDAASEAGYHVENVLLKQLKERKFNQVKTWRDKRTGKMVIDQKEVPEFAIEILPPLTEEELRDLANVQAAAGAID